MSSENALIYLSNNIERESDALFPFALLLNSLASVGGSAGKIKQIIAEKLFSERDVLSTYNYWLKSSSMRSHEAYPNDLDDTCCVWVGLAKHKPSLMDEKTFFELLTVFSYCYDAKNNQYQTWIVRKQNSLWLDCDLGVNINVLRLFSQYGFRPKKAHAVLDSAIALGKLQSVYYCGELPLIYFLSDFYRGSQLNILKEKLKSIILLKQRDPALVVAMIAALRFGFTDLISGALIGQMRSFQKSDGSYPMFPFYYYEQEDAKENYYHDDLISTGFYLELEGLLEWRRMEKEKKRQKSRLVDFIKKSLIQINYRSLEDELFKRAKKVIEADSSELLIFLTDRLYADLGQSKNDCIDLSLLASLQIFASLAYEIYDDINDESKNSAFLPYANMSIYLLFQQMSLLKKPLFYQEKLIHFLYAIENNFCVEKDKLSLQKSVWKVINELSEAQVHQITFEKVKAVAFSSYVLLDLLKIPDRETIMKIINVIYLIKQLNDDLRDCFTDLKNRQLNSANYHLIKEIAVYKNKNALLNSDHQLKKFFYSKVLFVIQTKILNNIQEAQNLLKNQHSINQEGFFRKILYTYEKILIAQMRRANVFQYLAFQSAAIHNENFITIKKQTTSRSFKGTQSFS